MGVHIQPVFSIPLVSTIKNDHVELNEKLCNIFLSNEKECYSNGNALVNKNKSVFESKFDLFDSSKDESILELQQFCWKTLYGVIGELNNYDINTLRKLHIASSSWFHITRKGGYFGIHNHPNASWSGVYCVKCGDKPKSDENSGILNFISPHMASLSYADKSITNLKGQYSRGNFEVDLKEGQLVIFPSWLLHEVKPYFGEKERITVAFNAWFKMAT